jgi:DNA-binding transcriptional MocR family regulator
VVRVSRRNSSDAGNRPGEFRFSSTWSYELLLHDPEAAAFESALGGDELGIAYEIGTLSKVLAPALRIGYLLVERPPARIRKDRARGIVHGDDVEAQLA